jgi:hypothetical protein
MALDVFGFGQDTVWFLLVAGTKGLCSVWLCTFRHPDLHVGINLGRIVASIHTDIDSLTAIKYTVEELKVEHSIARGRCGWIDGICDGLLKDLGVTMDKIGEE